MEYNVLVTKRRLFGKNTVLKGTIIRDDMVECEDWLGYKGMANFIVIKLENGKVIKILDDGLNILKRYKFEKL